LSLLKRARKAFWATSVAHFFGFFLDFFGFLGFFGGAGMVGNIRHLCGADFWFWLTPDLFRLRRVT
jgi:hypothetical protein